MLLPLCGPPTHGPSAVQTQRTLLLVNSVFQLYMGPAAQDGTGMPYALLTQ